MKPDGTLITQVSNLMVSATQEAAAISQHLLNRVVYTHDHQPPEADDQLVESNLACQLRRAVLVQEVTSSLLCTLLKIK